MGTLARNSWGNQSRRREIEPLGLRDPLAEAVAQECASVRGTRLGFMDWALMVPEPKAGRLRFDLFPPQRELYEEGADDKEVTIQKCLDPSTRVLRADLRWVTLEDVEVGDRLVGMDEHTREPRQPGSKRRARTLLPTTVEAKWGTRDEAVRLTFDDGRTLIATSKHRLLWKRRVGRGPQRDHAHGAGTWAGIIDWCPVGYMAVGDKVRHVTQPWDTPGYEDGWMGGILDGEGCLRSIGKRSGGTEVIITQQPGAVLDRVLRYLRDGAYTVGQRLEPRLNGRPVARVTVRRISEALRLIGATLPSRFADEWWEGAKLSGGGESWATIVAIEPLGKRPMIDLQTSTKTYVAEGLASHNSTQVGCSAWALRWAMYHTDTRGRTGLYIMPTAGDVYDFAAARIRPVIDASEHLLNRIPPGYADNMGLKRIGRGFIYWRGSESKRKLDSVDADHIVFDEYDNLSHEHIPDAERRISSPLSAGMLRRIGVPSIPDWGIAKEFDLSDRRRWHVKCAGCGEWQTVTFAENVDQKRGLRVCRRCAKSIEDVIAGGEWVAEFPGRAVRGYHMTRLIIPMTNIAEIVKSSTKRSPSDRQVFHNKDLGEPFAPAEGRMSRSVLAAAQSAGQGYAAATTMNEAVPSPPSKLRTMGIDVATTRNLNVRISEHVDDDRKIALFVGEVESFADLDVLMDRYSVHMAVIDHLPEGRMARTFAERFPGRVYIVALTGNSPRQPEPIKIKDDERFVSVKKLAALDATFEMLRSQRNLLPINLPEGYVEQMMAPVRVVEEDAVGNRVASYRSVGPDDFALAEAYDVVATDLAARAEILLAAQEESFEQLDDSLDFERSHLRAYSGDEDYYGGREDR